MIAYVMYENNGIIRQGKEYVKLFDRIMHEPDN